MKIEGDSSQAGFLFSAYDSEGKIRRRAKDAEMPLSIDTTSRVELVSVRKGGWIVCSEGER